MPLLFPVHDQFQPVGGVSNYITGAGGSFANQGGGFGDFRNPTLIPDVDQPVVNLAGNVLALQQAGSGFWAPSILVPLQSPDEFLTTFPRVAATQTVTVGGTATAGNVVTVTFVNPIFVALGNGSSSRTVSVTVGASPTTATVAEQLANAVETDAIVGLAIYPTVGGAAGAVVTLNWPGPVGNLTTLTQTSTGATTLTLGGASMSGGSGPVMAFGNFWASIGNNVTAMQQLGTVVGSGQAQAFFYGHPYNLSVDAVTNLVNSSAPIV